MHVIIKHAGYAYFHFGAEMMLQGCCFCVTDLDIFHDNIYVI